VLIGAGQHWCTANGCVARTAASTRASSCASRTRCSPTWGWRPCPERARRELLATGETVRKRTVETLDELTPQEAQITRLAAEGNTNPEIGAHLFLSPRTVESHLRKVFGKLGISPRKELRSALSDAGAAAVPV
jgi:DNA-binding NarL/FixJ family response regulator